MPSPLLERRRHKRLPTRDLSIQIEGYCNSVPAYAPNLSVDGMFVNTHLTIPRGALLKLKFRLADTGDLVETCGEVRYVLEGIGVGIEFVALAPDMRRRILAQLEIIATRKAEEEMAQPARSV